MPLPNRLASGFIPFLKLIKSVRGYFSHSPVNSGNLKFGTLEDVGQANVYLDCKPAIFGGFVIRGKSKGNYNPLFLRYLLASPTARKRIIVKGAGAQHFNISQDKHSLDQHLLMFQNYVEIQYLHSLRHKYLNHLLEVLPMHEYYHSRYIDC